MHTNRMEGPVPHLEGHCPRCRSNASIAVGNIAGHDVWWCLRCNDPMGVSPGERARELYNLGIIGSDSKYEEERPC